MYHLSVKMYVFEVKEFISDLKNTFGIISSPQIQDGRHFQTKKCVFELFLTIYKEQDTTFLS